MTYQLSVQRIQTVCLFELQWGQGQRLRSQVPYPAQLTTRYQQWQRAYLNFYKQALRGRVGAVGQVTTTASDLHSHLVQAEARLLSEFHRWLRQGDLADIRKTLSLATREQAIDLFLTCDPLELTRLPWETWEIGHDYGEAPIRIARSPNTIRMAPPALAPRRAKTRVLVILGDETGLNFAGDRQALQSLSRLLEITFVGWTPGQDGAALRTAICQTIADPTGWDILFFAGHSNEADAVAGQIYVAPQTALSIYELQPYLQVAQANGLQFALFNSCSGLAIADALIEQGLSQVAIMREPIHNAVAHSFLKPFLQALADHHDVQTALQAACHQLKLEQHLTYPSAYLVPSLFRHPHSVPFQLPERGWRAALRQWLPTPAQAIALSVILALSVVPGLQERLLASRLLTQAMYRNLTGQLAPTAVAPVVLVQVDTPSQRREPDLVDISPISQRYLARLLNRFDQIQAESGLPPSPPVIGIDYLLDLPQPDQSPELAAAVRQSIAAHQTWFVFSAIFEGGEVVGVNPDAQIMEPTWALTGYTNAPNWYMALPWEPEICPESCPFPYLLALAAQAAAHPTWPQPQLNRTDRLQDSLAAAIAQSDHPAHQTLAQQRIAGITAVGGTLNQRWLRPILDFSLPPQQVFHRISAYEVLTEPMDAKTADLIDRAAVILIGGVGYAEGGVVALATDLSPVPPAIAYWRQRGQDDSHERTVAGVEAIAYDVHHFLTDHSVTPIPALWVVGLAAGLGAGLVVVGWPRGQSHRHGLMLLVGGTLGYGLLCTQAMITTGILWPWLLPSATVWIYVLPHIRRI